jgi:hypothetical protein
MKKIFIILIIFSINCFAAAPNWFINRNITHKTYEIIGYGSGTTFAEANTNAKKDIAEQLVVNIKSDNEISQYLKNNDYSKFIRQNIKTSTNIKVSGIKKIKTEKKDNLYYVALKYMNLPLTAKVFNDFKDNICKGKKETNKYLLLTELANEFKNKFNCIPNITLFNNNGLWFVEIKGNSYFLDFKDFIKLFKEGGAPEIFFMPSKRHLKSGEIYHFIIYPKEKGYLSLYQVNKKGDVFLFIDNEPVVANMELVYPNLDEYDGLEAVAKSGGREMDLTIATLCKEKMQNGIFSIISENVEEGYGGFDRLIDMIDKCKVYSIITEVK